jgi:hypothetical protein
MNMPLRKSRLIMAGVTLLLFARVAIAQAPFTFADFERLHKDLFSAKEAWQEIPWRLSLVEAQAAAAKAKKPIYMLVRSGHPLGCV